MLTKSYTKIQDSHREFQELSQLDVSVEFFAIISKLLKHSGFNNFIEWSENIFESVFLAVMNILRSREKSANISQIDPNFLSKNRSW